MLNRKCTTVLPFCYDPNVTMDFYFLIYLFFTLSFTLSFLKVLGFVTRYFLSLVTFCLLFTLFRTLREWWNSLRRLVLRLPLVVPSWPTWGTYFFVSTLKSLWFLGSQTPCFMTSLLLVYIFLRTSLRSLGECKSRLMTGSVRGSDLVLGRFSTFLSHESWVCPDLYDGQRWLV